MSNKNITATIDGNKNIIIQGINNTTITINPDNTDEVHDFLLNIHDEINDIPLKIIQLLKTNSLQVNNKITPNANVYLTTLLRIKEEHPRNPSLSFGITITNLTREIRYFNFPFFKTSHKFKTLGGSRQDTFAMKQDESRFQNFPYRLEFGQTVDCNFPIKQGLIDIVKGLGEEHSDAYIQAFVKTTIGELYSSKEYKVSQLIKDFEQVQSLK